MSKKAATILIIILVLLMVGGFVGFYLYLNRGPQSLTKPPSTGSNQPIDLFPFPDSTPPGSGPGDIPLGNQPPGGDPLSSPTSKLRKISAEPVAGATFIEKENLSSVRFVERKTLSRIFETSLDTLKRLRLGNTNIPRVIYEGMWAERGEGVVIRYLREDDETIESFYGRLADKELATTTSRSNTSTDGEEASKDIEPTLLPPNIKSVAVSPKQDRIFYVTTNTAGATGVIMNLSSNQKTTLFESPTQEWSVSWPKEDLVGATTNPGSLTPGYFYLINLKTNVSQKIIGGVNGLTALSNPTGELIMYSGAINGEIETSIYTVKTAGVQRLTIKTLPEKCAWSVKETYVLYCAVPKELPTAAYPDAWYQGEIHFTDELLKIDAISGDIDTISDDAVLRENMDIIDLSLNKTESALLFKNKNDLSLWAFVVE